MDQFINTLYAQIKYRTRTANRKKSHLYYGLDCFSKEDFIKFCQSEELEILYSAWVKSGKLRKLCPTVDRIDSSRGYTLDNVRWVTLSENSKAADFSKRILANKQSRYTGVKRSRSGKWHARIRNNYKETYLGTYDNEEDAYQAYLIAKKELGR